MLLINDQTVCTLIRGWHWQHCGNKSCWCPGLPSNPAILTEPEPDGTVFSNNHHTDTGHVDQPTELLLPNCKMPIRFSDYNLYRCLEEELMVKKMFKFPSKLAFFLIHHLLFELEGDVGIMISFTTPCCLAKQMLNWIHCGLVEMQGAEKAELDFIKNPINNVFHKLYYPAVSVHVMAWTFSKVHVCTCKLHGVEWLKMVEYHYYI